MNKKNNKDLLHMVIFIASLTVFSLGTYVLIQINWWLYIGFMAIVLAYGIKTNTEIDKET